MTLSGPYVGYRLVILSFPVLSRQPEKKAGVPRSSETSYRCWGSQIGSSIR